MFKLQLPAALAVLALAAGCAPTTYLSLKPEQGSGIWREGHEQASTTQDSVQVQVGFVRYEADALVFMVDIQNLSGKALLVAPEQFSYLPTAQLLPPGATYMPHFAGPVPAINPERRLNQLQASIAYNVRESQRPLVLASPEYGQQYRIEHSTAAIQAQGQKQEAEARLLRKNTLAPGQGIKGYVYFPRTDNADRLQLQLPLRTQAVAIHYGQLRSRQPAN